MAAWLASVRVLRKPRIVRQWFGRLYDRQNRCRRRHCRTLLCVVAKGKLISRSQNVTIGLGDLPAGSWLVSSPKDTDDDTNLLKQIHICTNIYIYVELGTMQTMHRVSKGGYRLFYRIDAGRLLLFSLHHVQLATFTWLLQRQLLLLLLQDTFVKMS